MGYRLVDPTKHYDLARVQRLPWPADYAAKLI
jgi:hypothetical protein